MMQHTYLMLLPATVHAYDEGFLFQVVVLHLLELVLFYRSVNRFKYIINKNPGAGCILGCKKTRKMNKNKLQMPFHDIKT